MRTAQDLLIELNASDESPRIEAKRAREIGKSIAEYRRLRVVANPQAEELAYDNDDMLEALSAVRRVGSVLRPTLAGLVLFGKPMALRRLFPALRIDYVRVVGTQWVGNPESPNHQLQAYTLPNKP